MRDTAAKQRLEDHWCRVEGEEIHSAIAVGPPPATAEDVVFIHGVTSGAIFTPTAERVAPFASVWVLDLPGIGKSKGAALPSNTRGYCAAIAKWMDTAGIDSAHFVGQSYGSAIVAELAVLHPRRVKSVSLQGTVLEPERRQLAKLGLRWIVNSMQERPKAKALAQGQKEIGGKAIKHLIGLMLSHRPEDGFSRINCPALIIHAERDVLSSRQWAQAIADAIPGAAFCEAAGSTHSMPAQDPGGLVSGLLPFILPQYQELEI